MLQGNVLVNQKSEQQAGLVAKQGKQRTQNQGNAQPFASLLPQQNTFSFSTDLQSQNNIQAPQSVTRNQLTTGQVAPFMPAPLAASGNQHVANMQTAVQQNINKRNVQSQMPHNILQSNTTARTKRTVTANPSRGYAFGMEDTRMVRSSQTPQTVSATTQHNISVVQTQTAHASASSKSRVQLLLPHLLKRADVDFTFAQPNSKALTTQQTNTQTAQKTALQPLYKGTNTASQNKGVPAQLVALHSANTFAGSGKTTPQSAALVAAQPSISGGGIPYMPARTNLSSTTDAGMGGSNANPIMGTGMSSTGAGALTPAALNKILGSQPADTSMTFGAVPHPTAYLRGGENPAEMALRTANHKRDNGASQKAHNQGIEQKANRTNLILAQAQISTVATDDAATEPLGQLVARFESGSEGISAIGYDGVGGTSYGKYQISSRKGTMKRFLGYLQENAPDLATRLAKTGAANTGGRSGRMPNIWKQIATEDPARFEQLQDDFIQKTHLDPAVQGIADNSGISFNALPSALKEVLFSTAVQHGPAGAIRIVTRALKRVGNLEKTDTTAYQSIYNNGKQLIKDIYAIRARQFGSSTAEVQAAVKSRLNKEMQVALTMFNQHVA